MLAGYSAKHWVVRTAELSAESMADSMVAHLVVELAVRTVVAKVDRTVLHLVAWWADCLAAH